jgi:fluoride exporter
MKILYLLAGGAVGTVLRYLVSGFSHRMFETTFPLGTLVVNLAGSFLIGLTWGLTESQNFSPNLKAFIFIGIFGGFTTFSSYSLETMEMIRSGAAGMGILNILLSNILGLGLVFIGLFSGKAIVQLIK